MSATILDVEERNFVRQTKRGAARCTRLQEAAAALFLEHGYDGVSLDDIIAVSGGSKSNIYSHFGGKEGLFVATVEALCDQANASLNDVDLSDLDVEAGLQRLSAVMISVVTNITSVQLFRLIVAQSARFPTLGPAWVQHGPQATRRTLAAFFLGHQDRLRGITPEQAAIIYHNLLCWDVRTAAVSGMIHTLNIEAHIARVVSQFAHGFLKPATEGS